MISALGAPRVLVVGDLILDEYLRGSVRRISPEAPVPVLEHGSTERALGGAANVAHNLVALGCEVVLCGAVGEDALGDELVALLESGGIDTAGVIRVPSRPTTHKLRVVAQGQHVLRIDREQIGPLPEASARDAIRRIGALLQRVEGVVCSDYKKGVVSSPVVEALMKGAAEAGVGVVVDPKGTDYGRYRGARVITPNLSELHVATGIEIHTSADIDEAAAKLQASTGAEALLVTCGKDGMVLYQADSRYHISAQAREVYDVTGAGDTVIAALALALFSGEPLVDSARLANAAAGVVVGKLGTATVTRDELSVYLDGHGAPSAQKVVSGPVARDILLKARSAGRRVVFTNGCFDLLHAGHVRYLQAARELGDLLVVGLNSDRSVRALKGPSRPLVGQAERAQLLAALGCVDLVVIFDEPTPAEVIAGLVPDVLVKGADYEPDQVVGRDAVEAAGGRLVLIPLVEGQSTSKLVESIVAKHGAERC